MHFTNAAAFLDTSATEEGKLFPSTTPKEALLFHGAADFYADAAAFSPAPAAATDSTCAAKAASIP